MFLKKKNFKKNHSEIIFLNIFARFFPFCPLFLSKHVFKKFIFQDKEPTNVPDPVVMDKPRRGRKPKNPLPKPDDSSAVPEVNS